ncbi:hypothetical protein PENSPDRAFT_574665 [Peniophora sp. CONT]|nr:hypothetical protein PENSPDRAFT_574665 [Peniophora sp. CONT]
MLRSLSLTDEPVSTGRRYSSTAPSVQPLEIPVSRSSSLFSDGASPVASSSSPIAYLASPLSPSQYSPVHEKRPAHTTNTPPAPDPFVDISRLRIRQQAHHCLYPGSTFEGTQKSGRNSYEVKVTIVDVDFAASHLCGYLCIRGLTDDWPELTTYFDAEIIGTRHGFLTRKWDADDEEDLVHWGRFPAFRHVKNKLKGPLLTTDAPVDAVFMRWKERFLVPDHRVQDINGASFAGFYYVCVDFNAHPSSLPSQAPSSPVRERADLPPAPKPDASPRRARTRSMRSDAPAPLDRSVSSSARGAPVAATMSGFYFHQHSEPYQQLSLKHVPQSVSTGFELR